MKVQFSVLGFLFVVEFLGLVIATSFTIPEFFDPKSCPPDFKNHPLIVISMDGFRADYVEKGMTPVVEALAREGVSAPFMKPSYPSITFPNHYTIVTGLLPPYHGIIANKFFDPHFNATFRVGRKEFYQRRFWGGEPIWKTAERQGKIAAVQFWLGSETEGLRPTHWEKYNESLPFESRVNKILEWLDLTSDLRPDLINMYLHEPDRQGHEYGPESAQVNEALIRVDKTLRSLIDGLIHRNLLSCVNLVLLADHGMAAAGEERLIHLQDYIPDINITTKFWDGVFPRFERIDHSSEKTQSMMKTLSCIRPEMRVYGKRDAPMRWHLGGQRRVEDVVLDMDQGFQIDFDQTYEPDKGDHGFDNIFHVMNALFLAHGPSFRRGVEVETFQNIEIYNLLCTLLGVVPAPNNGTWGGLHHLLNKPPPITENLEIKRPKFGEIPDYTFDVFYRLVTTCTSEEEKELNLNWISVLLAAERDRNVLLKSFLPWGIPQSEKTEMKLLLHPDHITGFSEDLHSPLWIAFNLQQIKKSPVHFQSFEWIDDIRIKDKFIKNPCGDGTQSAEFSFQPLFDPDFSAKAIFKSLPYLSSNAVPLTKFLKVRWSKLRLLLEHWRGIYGPGINVVMGTVYDHDGDTLADDVSSISKFKDGVAVPTHLFAIVIRCLGRSEVYNCSPKRLDVNSFIFPQELKVSNCMNFIDFAREFSAKLDDVEKATGMKFLPGLSYYDRTRLKIRFHSNIWGLESWQNRIRSDIFGLKKR